MEIKRASLYPPSPVPLECVVPCHSILLYFIYSSYQYLNCSSYVFTCLLSVCPTKLQGLRGGRVLLSHSSLTPSTWTVPATLHVKYFNQMID